MAGTSILTSSGYVAIETIKDGDYVYSENPETGEKALKKVVRTFIRETSELIHVKVNGKEITTTPEHHRSVGANNKVQYVDITN